MKVQDLIDLLKDDGWFQVRIQYSSFRRRPESSPSYFQKLGTVTVSGKPSVDVPPGTLASVLRQAGLKK